MIIKWLKMNINLNDLIDIILSKVKPVAFFDTCFYLDIMRALDRVDAIHSGNFLSKINTLKQNHKQDFYLVCSQRSEEEYNNNFPQVKEELKSFLNKQKNEHHKYIKFLSDFNPRFSLQTTGLDHTELENAFIGSTNDLFAVSYKIENEDDHKRKAFSRCIDKIAPSKKGDSLADCLIFETLLDFAKQLRDRNFDDKIFFLTSNKRDFGEVDNSDHTISIELNNFNVNYLNTYNWLFNELNL